MEAEEEEDICCSNIIKEQRLRPPPPQRWWGRWGSTVKKSSGKLCYTDEVSCIMGENRLYKKISMNSAKNRVSPTPQKTHKGRKKPYVVKGQWTIEEDKWEI